jgi:hypothetical protein
MLHNIRILASRGGYAVSGAVSIAASVRPMVDAARALLEAGHDPADLLKAVADGVSLSPVVLHKLVRPYAPPRAAWGVHRDAARAAASRA